jgi:hypothetical protein
MSVSVIPGIRRRYKLAYLVLAQERAGFDQLKSLLEILDDGQAIILIHVERNMNQLYLEIENYITQRKVKFQNIYLAKNRYQNTPGHVSLVYTYLSGFFELRDIADWDFVINLSNFDWPLRRNAEVYQILSQNPKSSYIDYWINNGFKY